MHSKFIPMRNTYKQLVNLASEVKLSKQRYVQNVVFSQEAKDTQTVDWISLDQFISQWKHKKETQIIVCIMTTTLTSCY